MNQQAIQRGGPSGNSKIAPAKAQKKALRVEMVAVNDGAIVLNQTLSGTLEAVTKIRKKRGGLIIRPPR